MHRFSGTFEHAIDDKNRVAIPAKYRDVLVGLHQPGLMVTRFREGERRCLDVYPLSAWEDLEAKLQKAIKDYNTAFGKGDKK